MWTCVARGSPCVPTTSAGIHVRMFGLGRISGNWKGSGFFFMHCAAHDLEATLVVLTSWNATRVVNRRLYSALMYDWNTRVRAGLGSSWVAHVLFSVRVPD